MTKTWFMARCNEIWAKEGLETLTGHCFRIGRATELLLRGVAPEVVQALGPGNHKPSWNIGAK